MDGRSRSDSVTDSPVSASAVVDRIATPKLCDARRAVFSFGCRFRHFRYAVKHSPAEADRSRGAGALKIDSLQVARFKAFSLVHRAHSDLRRCRSFNTCFQLPAQVKNLAIARFEGWPTLVSLLLFLTCPVVNPSGIAASIDHRYGCR